MTVDDFDNVVRALLRVPHAPKKKPAKGKPAQKKNPTKNKSRGQQGRLRKGA